MPRFEQRRWTADLGAFGGRRSRQSFLYRAFVPDDLATTSFHLSSEVVGVIAEAERALAGLNANPPTLASLEAVARRLLRSESVASSRIEGLVLSQRRLAKAELGGKDALDETAASVLGNVRAMEDAIALGSAARRIRLDDLLSIHATLMSASAQAKIAGRLRTEQNWIGGGALSPRDAEFIPPPPEFVEPLLEDLVAFVERDDLPAVFQAALAHAQFETIHPFADGNGRVGRALVHVVLRRRGLATRFVPPVSLVLAGNANAYVRGLTAFRAGEVDEWAGLFAAAVRTSVQKAQLLADELSRLQEVWLEKAGHPRRHSAAVSIIALLPSHPLLTVASAQALTGRSTQAVNEALAALERAKVVAQLSVGKRNRAFEAVGLFDLVNSFEEALAAEERPAPRGGRASDFRDE